MRELLSQEIQHVSGANVFKDLQTVVQQGLSDPQKTFAVVVLSAGLTVGGVMARYIGAWGGPLCGLALSAGWYFYDKHFPNGALPVTALSTKE